MTSFISHTTLDCHDAFALSEWWKRLLGYVDIEGDPNGPGDEECLIQDPGSGHRLLFIEVPDEHLPAKRIHFDVRPRSGTQAAEIDRTGTFCRARNAPVLAVYDVGNLEEIKKYNAITMDGDDRITFFEEKPKEPKSTLTGIALYYYPKHTIPLIRQYIAEGNNPDQPGRLVQWLYPRTAVYTWRVPGLWFDIGSKETLEEANRIFAKK